MKSGTHILGLNQLLELVGKLDDSSGADMPRERFRRFLAANVTEVGLVRDYIDECLRQSGDQYNRAFQDLVNHLGRLLEFDVTFGRYHGTQGQLGYDGHWRSVDGFHLVVEVKTTEAYSVKTASLIGYIDGLISQREIPGWDEALGLYVVGRPNPEVRQLENSIVAERRTQQLRIMNVQSLLSLADMMKDYDVSQQDVLAVIRPSGPTIDPVVDVMGRLIGQRPAPPSRPEEPVQEEPMAAAGQPTCWLTPVKSDEAMSSEETVSSLVGQHGIYAFGERTPGRKHIKAGDKICFYSTATGVIGHATVATKPEKKAHPAVRHPDQYPWVFGVKDIRLYVDSPVVIDAQLRSQLDAFQHRDPTRGWAWFVQATRRVTLDDFRRLTH